MGGPKKRSPLKHVEVSQAVEAIDALTRDYMVYFEGTVREQKDRDKVVRCSGARRASDDRLQSVEELRFSGRAATRRLGARSRYTKDGCCTSAPEAGAATAYTFSERVCAAWCACAGERRGARGWVCSRIFCQNNRTSTTYPPGTM
ncbi:hypothetical protein DQ04_00281220 [Trypanosoma grayi]|uniref:hypothetical protein n=1 Tax=Trypanosoma grayi TaxID=71804 RepID=UPI0004F47C55|nr:hypothetical protein DQ04_00281220 [Trypanosoma grayi]KEG14859.1 hypothetical protein DQ04_00281220 [Trypanosoma grayi]